MRRPAMLALVSLLLEAAATPARAQAPAAPPPSAPSPATDNLKPGATDVPSTPEGYAYNPMGRRDPFISLLKRLSPEETRTRRPGVEGFMIQEVALKGIVKTPKGYTAMLLGPDGVKSYFVGVGQRLFDGVVTGIDATTVTFRQEVTDPLSTVKSRDIKKTLYPSEEARQ
jgi:type IV pilus assembly protein PilP